MEHIEQVEVEKKHRKGGANVLHKTTGSNKAHRESKTKLKLLGTKNR